MNGWWMAGCWLERIAQSGIMVEVVYVPKHLGENNWRASFYPKGLQDRLLAPVPTFWGRSGPEAVQKAFLVWQEHSQDLDRLDYNI